MRPSAVSPWFFAGSILGVWQCAYAWYHNHLAIPDLKALGGLLGLALGTGIVQVLLGGGVLVLLRRLLGRPAWSDAVAFKLGLGIAGAVGMVPLAGRVLGPLVAEGRLPTLLLWPVVLSVAAAAGIAAIRLAPDTDRPLKWGSLVSLVALVLLSIPAIDNLFTLRFQALASLDPSEGAPALPADAPDVVLVTVDTLRADALGAWGGPPSPAIDTLVAEGVGFSRCVAPAPWTLPSMAAMLSGVPASETGAGRLTHPLRFAARTPVHSELPMLAEQFGDAGYATAGLVGNPWLSPYFGMTRGFVRFENPTVRNEAFSIFEEIPIVGLALSLLPRRERGDDRAIAITDGAQDWLAEAKAPLFLWVHYIEPHSPYEADPANAGDTSMLTELGGGLALQDDGSLVGDHFSAVGEIRAGRVLPTQADRDQLRALYAAEVEHLDQQLGRLFETLRARPQQTGRPVVVAFAADHGEEFWDHGGFEHAHAYWREVTGVPLAFWSSDGRVPAGPMEAEPVGLVDVGPTLIELSGLPPLPAPETPFRGRSLVGDWAPAAEHEEAEGPDGFDGPGVAVAAAVEAPVATTPPRLSELNLFNLPARMVVDGRWHLVRDAEGGVRLFDVVADPGEMRDLSFARPDVVERLGGLLDAQPGGDASVVAGAGDGVEGPDAAAMEGLRALGYLD